MSRAVAMVSVRLITFPAQSHVKTKHAKRRVVYECFCSISEAKKTLRNCNVQKLHAYAGVRQFASFYSERLRCVVPRDFPGGDIFNGAYFPVGSG